MPKQEPRFFSILQTTLYLQKVCVFIQSFKINISSNYEKIHEAFKKEKLEVAVFEEVRGGMMATIKREKFMAIQAKGNDVGNDKDVVDVVIDDVVEKNFQTPPQRRETASKSHENTIEMQRILHRGATNTSL